MPNQPSAEEVLVALKETESYKKAAKKLGIPKSTFYERYIQKDILGIAGEYRAMVEARKGGTQGDEIRPRSHYDLNGGYYRFYAPSLYPSPYLVDEATWRNICFRYSSEGDNATKGQLAMEYDIPRGILEKLLRIYGMYKVDPPFTHEQMAAAGEPEIQTMLDETVERKKHSFLIQLQRREKESLIKELMELRGEVYNRSKTLEMLKMAVEEASVPSAEEIPRRIHTRDQEFDNVVAFMADLHAGKLAWGQESYGGDYDLEESSRRVVWTGFKIQEFIDDLPRMVNNLHLADVGDTFHALVGHTEGMTFLDQDSRPYKVWQKTYEAIVTRIEMLRDYAETIHLYFSPGNHDWVLLQFFYFTLAERYRDVEDVVVHVGPRWQSYFIEGRTAHIFDHGKGIGENLNTNATKLAADRVARDLLGDDYYRVEHIIFYVGHLHALSMAMEGKHLRLMRLLPLTAGDSYEAKGRYSGDSGAQIATLKPDGRLDLVKEVYVGVD